MQVRFVYCDPKIYRMSAIVFSRPFDKAINTRRERSRSRQGSYDLKSVKAILLRDIRPSRAADMYSASAENILWQSRDRANAAAEDKAIAPNVARRSG